MKGRRPRSASYRFAPMLCLIVLTLSGIAYLAKIDSASGSMAGFANWLSAPGSSTRATTVLLSSDAVVLPVATGQTGITAMIRATNGKPIVGTQVQFSSTLGAITPVIAVSDSNGIARALFRSGTSTGQAIVTASIGTVSQQIFLQINSLARAPADRTMTLAVVRPSLTVGEQTQVIATLRDNAGQPVMGEAVTLFGSLGVLSPANAITDNNGQVRATFTAGRSAGQARLTALAGYTSSTIVLSLQGTLTSPPIFLPFVRR